MNNSTQEKSTIQTTEAEIVSVKTPNMVIVEVTRIWRHPIYRKPLKRAKRFAAHNESLALVVGDHVLIAQIKPMSKTKHFRVVNKI